MANISIRYQIAQKVRSWRLKRKYTLKDLAGKANINYHTLLRYEQGTCGIPIEKLKILAGALSIPVGNLFPRRKVLKESCCFDEARSQEMYNFIEKTGGHKAIYALTKSVRAEEESNIKAARIRIARNLVKAGFDTEIIYRTTGLSTEEYADKERYEPNGGQEIKKWRIIRGYTQEELAKKLNVGPSQVHHYEQGSATILSERLCEIARELSVDAEDLIKEEDNYEDGEAENELLGLAREYRKIDNQESRDELNIWVEFLLQRKQIYKEKIYKTEEMKVANNLLQLGFSTDVISKIVTTSFT
ncbi:helix-turn-helix domain-containing protein [Wolbachia endosymbiont of Diaphorina citri]|uniref:WO male-killing family protein Wmk n=1 Tax=Wolbachia endosymbiont of Diaphorina citri TaxID=116598 RepID=UPI00047675ED|nr:helix-turn-helix domain-containing protein [Wolbachia endosymbiont of Diaphorina citri]QJT94914.1 helix-turn-helix domain-containing protein [Wolbachia endosymbiont of Diaphorina citri]QJT97378.1 helix-turn-helix domain-containing protein [Wolbachia endosymbiont of Diaphorina citri]QLK11862.1 helix-turn-helix domain-containing protein [Wolbachia endosymbiont of Diaphorina citri]QXY86793.1 helix-turn-helix domain-containing protein [Wolbachia endosymbiont of Diaphorina citri]QXY88007.1 helix